MTRRLPGPADWPLVCVAVWPLPAVAGTFLRPRAVLLTRRLEAGLLRDRGLGVPVAHWWGRSQLPSGGPGMPMYRLCKYACQGLFSGQGSEASNQRKDSISISACDSWDCLGGAGVGGNSVEPDFAQTARGSLPVALRCSLPKASLPGWPLCRLSSGCEPVALGGEAGPLALGPRV